MVDFSIWVLLILWHNCSARRTHLKPQLYCQQWCASGVAGAQLRSTCSISSVYSRLCTKTSDSIISSRERAANCRGTWSVFVMDGFLMIGKFPVGSGRCKQLTFKTFLIPPWCPTDTSERREYMQLHSTPVPNFICFSLPNPMLILIPVLLCSFKAVMGGGELLSSSAALLTCTPVPSAQGWLHIS